jgi:oligoribonuclease (3'-5' exoribonuclease)
MTIDNLFGNFPNITWIDVETGGVDESTDNLYEVAALVTDRNLNILDPHGFNMVIRYPAEEIEALRNAAHPVVQEMHDKTGLWYRLPDGAPLEEVDAQLHEYISQFSEPKTSWLGGNSITLDRNFLRANLPQSFGHISYRSIDVSTVAGLAKAWFGVTYEKKLLHSAFSDITESIEELRFYRDNIFKPISDN